MLYTHIRDLIYCMDVYYLLCFYLLIFIMYCHWFDELKFIYYYLYSHYNKNTIKASVKLITFAIWVHQFNRTFDPILDLFFRTYSRRHPNGISWVISIICAVMQTAR